MNNNATGGLPSVTIGLPVYNGARWLDETLLSLRQQTFDDFELVVSDNASTDSSLSICQHHAALDSRIRVLRNPTNIGANRNYLAVQSAARGRYFKWAAVGDLCAPTFLAECVEVLEADPGIVLAAPLTSVFSSEAADATPYMDDLELMDGDPAARFVRLLRRIRLNNAMNGVVRRDALDRALPMGVFWGGDTLMMAELALLGKFALVPRRLFFRRMSPETATRLRSDAQIEAHLDPVPGRKLTWQTWRYCARLLRIAVRSAPTFPAGVGALKEGMRVLVWSRRDLAQELRLQLKHLA
jgi:glycosyltransferase involved in cell wall biosynthesis